jgi:hypothetical protein
MGASRELGCGTSFLPASYSHKHFAYPLTAIDLPWPDPTQSRIQIAGGLENSLSHPLTTLIHSCHFNCSSRLGVYSSITMSDTHANSSKDTSATPCDDFESLLDYIDSTPCQIMIQSTCLGGSSKTRSESTSGTEKAHEEHDDGTSRAMRTTRAEYIVRLQGRPAHDTQEAKSIALAHFIQHTKCVSACACFPSFHHTWTLI